jgi:flagellar basal-body rod modification protein FlgD
MTTTAPVTSTAAAAAASTQSNAQQQLSGNFDTFLTLLTTQLQNQDPLNPMDSNQFTQQLVEFSQVEQQINTNTNLTTLINQGTSQSGSYAVNYLGKNVTVTNGNAALTNGAADWNYNLGTQAGQTTLTVTDANGNVVFSAPGATTPGNHDFAWNGQNSNGTQEPDGVYTLQASSTALDGSTVTTAVSSKGIVNEVDMTSGTPQLVIGSMEIPLSDIAGVSTL